MNLNDKISEMQVNGWMACLSSFGKWTHDIRGAVSKRIGGMSYGDARMVELREPFGEIHELWITMDDKGGVTYNIDGGAPAPKPEPVSAIETSYVIQCAKWLTVDWHDFDGERYRDQDIAEADVERFRKDYDRAQFRIVKRTEQIVTEPVVTFDIENAS